jgi:CheY-like chemotaxis protein
VVDDDLGCGRLLALLIRHLGHHAEHVDSGAKALEYLSNQKPDLVIMDIMMPEIDGLEVLRRMRQDADNAGIPVVMFSALADPQFCQSVRDRGANDYWVKANLDFRSLGQRLATYLPAQPAGMG